MDSTYCIGIDHSVDVANWITAALVLGKDNLYYSEWIVTLMLCNKLVLFLTHIGHNSDVAKLRTALVLVQGICMQWMA